MGVKSVMDAPPTAEEIKQFEEIDTENRIAEEEFEREIAAAKGEWTQSEIDPFDGADPRNERVRETERDARLRHKDYDAVIKPVESLIRQKPEVFEVLRDSLDAGEAAYALGQIMANPKLADHPKYKGFKEYLTDVANRKSGKFDNLSPTEMERVIEYYKANADEGETIEEFFKR